MDGDVDMFKVIVIVKYPEAVSTGLTEHHNALRVIGNWQYGYFDGRMFVYDDI
jgi:expansin (peptidoglycan-binding protein)